MKSIIIITLLFAPLIGLGQELSGYWKETGRADIYHQPITFRDTIKVQFLPGNEYTWFKKGGFIYRGTYKINENQIDFGARIFTLEARTADQLILSDEAAFYTFSPGIPPEPVRAKDPPDPDVVSDLSELHGRWKVYKGTSSQDIPSLDLSKRIKTIMIFNQPDKDGHIGYVSAGKDGPGNASWRIRKFENGILYCEGSSPKMLEVLKTGGGELIVRDEHRTFFLTQFKQ